MIGEDGAGIVAAAGDVGERDIGRAAAADAVGAVVLGHDIRDVDVGPKHADARATVVLHDIADELPARGCAHRGFFVLVAGGLVVLDDQAFDGVVLAGPVNAGG